jgi:hypothetical protein
VTMRDVYGDYVDWTVYRCHDCGMSFGYHGEPKSCPFCNGKDLEEDDNQRVCSHCGNLMRSGYCIENGMGYYCSDECLHEHFSDEEFRELYDDGRGDSYWTDWT